MAWGPGRTCGFKRAPTRMTIFCCGEANKDTRQLIVSGPMTASTTGKAVIKSAASAASRRFLQAVIQSAASAASPAAQKSAKNQEKVAFSTGIPIGCWARTMFESRVCAARFGVALLNSFKPRILSLQGAESEKLLSRHYQKTIFSYFFEVLSVRDQSQSLLQALKSNFPSKMVDLDA